MLPLLIALTAVAAPPKLELKGQMTTVDGLDLCFGSGMRIAYMVDPTHPTITIRSVVGSGATADPAGKEGLAHVVEHIWFRSIQGEHTVNDVHGDLGAWANASTSLDDTLYETIGPKGALDALMALEADRLLHPLQGVTAEVLAIEREVVRNELREGTENSARKGLGELRQLVYPKEHPYNRSIAGNHESLDSLTLDDALAFASEHYKPNNTTWVISGPWSRNEFAEILGPNLPNELVEDPDNPNAPLGRAKCPDRAPETDEFDFKPERAAVLVEAGVTKPMGMFGWALPSGFSNKWAQTQRAVWSLEAAMAEYDASCGVSAGRTGSLGFCAIPLGDMRAAEREPYLRDALDQIGYLWDRNWMTFQNRVFREEVGNQLADAFSSIETETAHQPGVRDLHHTGRFDTLIQYTNQIQGSAQDRDTKFMEKWINQRRAATLILMPRTDGTASGGNPHSSSVVAPRAPESAEIEDEDIAATVRIPDLDALKKVAFSNGLNLWILPLEGPPFAHASMIMDGNTASAPSPAIEMLRYVYHEDLNEVVDNQKLSQAPEVIGGNWYHNETSTTTTLGIRGASGNLDALLYLLRLRLDESKVVIEDRRGMKRVLDDLLWKDRDFVENWERELFDEHLGRVSTVFDEAFVEELKGVGIGQAQSWNKQIVNPVGATLLIVGRVDVAKAEQLARYQFADWRDRADGATPKVRAPERPTAARRIVLMNDATRTNADVHAACPLAETDAESDAVRSVLAAGLQAGLWTALRDRLGATYGVYSWATRQANGVGALHVQTEVQVEAAAATIDAILGGIALFGDDAGVPEEEIQRWKLMKARGTVLSQRTYSQIRHKLEWASTSGMGLEGLAEYPDRLAGVHLDDMQAELGPCAGSELITVAGPISRLRELLDEAEIAYEVLDWEQQRDDSMAELDPKRWRKEQRERRLR